MNKKTSPTEPTTEFIDYVADLIADRCSQWKIRLKCEIKFQRPFTASFIEQLYDIALKRVIEKEVIDPKVFRTGVIHGIYNDLQECKIRAERTKLRALLVKIANCLPPEQATRNENSWVTKTPAEIAAEMDKATSNKPETK